MLRLPGLAAGFLKPVKMIQRAYVVALMIIGSMVCASFVLLNHLIHELLPPRGDGLRWSNSDPVTGQAAWYDLRVRIEKAAPGGPSEPAVPAQRSPVGFGPRLLPKDHA
jgi:hypothetical protein